MDNMTAKVSCFARAYHHKNNSVHIFDDGVAEAILEKDYEEISKSMIEGLPFFFPDFKGTKEEGLRQIVDKQLAPSVLGRSAFCKRKLAEEIKNGCGQYLILASGYDTFSIRNTEKSLAVYELDFPEILTDKRERIKRNNLDTTAVYVPCNFAEISWKNKLIKAGYEKGEKTFGSLLGISYYLQKEDFEKLLMNLSEIMTVDSAVCFDYPSIEESSETRTNQMLAAGAEEQMKALYSNTEIVTLLQQCGFKLVEHLDSDEMTKQYFETYNRSTKYMPMKAPKGVGYVLAKKVH